MSYHVLPRWWSVQPVDGIVTFLRHYTVEMLLSTRCFARNVWRASCRFGFFEVTSLWVNWASGRGAHERYLYAYVLRVSTANRWWWSLRHQKQKERSYRRSGIIWFVLSPPRKRMLVAYYSSLAQQYINCLIEMTSNLFKTCTEIT